MIENISTTDIEVVSIMFDTKEVQFLGLMKGVKL